MAVLTAFSGGMLIFRVPPGRLELSASFRAVEHSHLRSRVTQFCASPRQPNPSGRLMAAREEGAAWRRRQRRLRSWWRHEQSVAAAFATATTTTTAATARGRRRWWSEGKEEAEHDTPPPGRRPGVLQIPGSRSVTWLATASTAPPSSGSSCCVLLGSTRNSFFLGDVAALLIRQWIHAGVRLWRYFGRIFMLFYVKVDLGSSGR